MSMSIAFLAIMPTNTLTLAGDNYAAHWVSMCNTNNWWCSIDPHFQDRSTSMSFALSAIIPTTTFTSELCDNEDRWLSNVWDLKSLALRWCSFLGWGEKRVLCQLGCDADRYTQCGVTWLSHLVIVKCERLKIVDTPLAFILRMGIWQTAFLHWIIVYNKLYSRYWHPEVYTQ
jgi:hypothetical protein